MVEAVEALGSDLAKAKSRQEKNLLAVVGAIDTLNSQISRARAALEGPEAPGIALDRLAHDLEEVDVLESVGAEHKNFHTTISKLCKSADKHVGADVEKIRRQVPLDEGSLHQVIAAHLYRRGAFKAAMRFAEDTSLSMPVEVSRELVDMHGVVKAIHDKDLEPAQKWVAQRREALSRVGSPLEFQLQRLHFISILQAGGSEQRRKAMVFAQEHLSPLATTHMRDIQELMGSILWIGHLEESPYSHLLSDDLWSVACYTLITDGCRIAGLPRESFLAVAFQAGVMAIPTMIKIAGVVQNSSRAPLEWEGLTELPIEVALAQSMSYHSIFSCPVSREQSTPDNPPLLLKCGHAVCRSSVSRLAKIGAKFKCPTCPMEQTESETKTLVL